MVKNKPQIFKQLPSLKYLQEENNSNKLFIFSILSLLLFLNVNIFAATDTGNVSLELFSNKQVYTVGENVNLTLMIDNNYNIPITGQIKGKVIIGDVGYEIQCFDYTAPSNDTKYLGLTPLTASMSNSNRKTMTTLYACSGTQMQSSKTMMDNTPISQSGQEVFELGPFTYSYNYNNTDYDVKSNTLNITVMVSQQQQQQDQQQSQSQDQQNQQQQNQNSQNQQPNTQNSQTGQNTQNSQNGQTNQTTQQDQGLNSQNQQALANNQQNSQSVNQLNKDIQDAKANPLNTQVQTQEKKEFWIWLLALLLVIVISLVLYFKYYKKEEIVEEIVPKKPEVPKYIILLNEIKNVSIEKEKAKLLSQAIRSYIAIKNNLDEDITHTKAIKLTKNKLFIEILQKTESIEFAGKKIKLDYDKLVKQLKGEMKHEE